MSTTSDYEVVLREPETLLRKRLGKDLQLISYECESLVKTGDNYGSSIMKLQARIRRGASDEEEELNLVAKMLPPTDYQREVFESGFTFKKEIFVYEELLPAYRQLLPDFDVTPEFYGARLSMKPDALEVDEDAVILLENLKYRGYYMGDRHKGLDAAHLDVLITALAKFHAIGLSIKYKNPSFFSKLTQYCKPLPINDEIMNPFLDNLMDCIRADPRTGPHADRIRSTKAPRFSLDYYQPLDPEHEWACLVHGDFWMNNALFHADEESSVVDDAKLLDFQTFYLNSPLSDLVFLLCTSMEPGLKKFDESLEAYRCAVAELLERIGCPELVGLMAKDSFEDRLRLDAKSELIHILLMVKVVELREGEDLVESPANEACLARISRIVDIFIENKWI